MLTRIFTLSMAMCLFLTACHKDRSTEPLTPSSGGANGGHGNGQPQAGTITAGEWNDLDNWGFWTGIINGQPYGTMPAYWSFFNNNRISVLVANPDGTPAIDVPVRLKMSGTEVFSARTDNSGKAELWTGLYQKNTSVDATTLSVDVNDGANVLTEVKLFSEGVNKVTTSATDQSNRVEVSFVVDATGSMGDELEFLKTELLDVLSKVKTNNPGREVYTSSVFYRDEGDEYVTRIAPLTDNVNSTVEFIKRQSAANGGDYPEAVHTALDNAVNGLQWSANARTRILFLLLDAPPHYTNNVISSLQASISKAAAMGIRIIPVTASGIDKETEFLMRIMAISTNGTYVFITDDSGVGGDHLEATVGDYQVEYLNELMVRLIGKYIK